MRDAGFSMKAVTTRAVVWSQIQLLSVVCCRLSAACCFTSLAYTACNGSCGLGLAANFGRPLGQILRVPGEAARFAKGE